MIGVQSGYAVENDEPLQHMYVEGDSLNMFRGEEDIHFWQFVLFQLSVCRYKPERDYFTVDIQLQAGGGWDLGQPCF